GGRHEAPAPPDALEQIRVEALGKKGEVSLLMRGLAGLDPEARREAGQRPNPVKDALSAAIETRKALLGEAALDAKLVGERVDVTLPPRPESEGRIHAV